MKADRIQDKYNKDKVWIIKKSTCNHYYLNQEILGNIQYKKFIRVTKKYLKSIGVLQ